MSWETIEPREEFEALISEQGGWVNAHAHIDRSHIINHDNWQQTDDKLQVKWPLADEFKRKATVGDIYDRMARVTEGLLEQGGQALGSFIDCDSVVEDKSLKAAERLRDNYGSDLELVFMNQPIKGLMDETERRWFEEASEFVDIIGGLPERDGHVDPALDRWEEHMDIIFSLASRLGKRLHIHIDQLNSPNQTDTARAIEKTREHNYAGKVTLVHCISLAAHPKPYRECVYDKLAEQDISIISCPSAWIDSRRNETAAPIHNAVTPIDEMIPAGVKVAVGTDNIADIYKPFSDGNMWAELRFLLEANHYYDIPELVQVATTNGLEALGLKDPSTVVELPAASSAHVA